MTDPERHDWPRIIREIKAGYGRRYRRKLTDYKLGLMIAGADHKAVQSWLKGKEPTHYQGQLLLAYVGEFHRGSLDNYHTRLRQKATT